MIHPIEMVCHAIYLAGRVLDRFLRPIGRNLGLFSRVTGAICRGLSLLGLQLGLLCLQCSFPVLVSRSAAASHSSCNGKGKRRGKD